MTRRPLEILALCLALAAGAAAAAGAAVPAATEREIAGLERDWNDAYAANDLPKYFGYYAGDAVLIFYGARTALGDYRQSWSESVRASPLESVKLTDLVVQVAPAGDTAVASYQLDVRTRHADGPSTDEHAFETDVWQRRGGAWKVVHVHYSTAAAK